MTLILTGFLFALLVVDPMMAFYLFGCLLTLGIFGLVLLNRARDRRIKKADTELRLQYLLKKEQRLKAKPRISI